jgi:hypothetical protein
LKWPVVLAAPNLCIADLRLGLSVSEFAHIAGVFVHMEGDKPLCFFEDKRTMSKKEEILRWPKEVQAMTTTSAQQNCLMSMFPLLQHLVMVGSQSSVWKTETL